MTVLIACEGFRLGQGSLWKLAAILPELLIGKWIASSLATLTFVLPVAKVSHRAVDRIESMRVGDIIVLHLSVSHIRSRLVLCLYMEALVLLALLSGLSLVG